MSAIRLGSPGVPVQLIPIDDGATPYRGNAYIAGDLVRPLANTPKRESSTTPERRAQMAAAYRRRRGL